MRLGFLVCKLKLDDGAASRRDGKSRYGTLLLHIDLGISHDKDALLEVAAPVATGEREHMLAGIVSELTLYGKVRGLHAQHARHLGGDDTREECGHREGGCAWKIIMRTSEMNVMTSSSVLESLKNRICN